MIFEAGQTQLKVSSKSRIQNIVGDTIPTNSQLENHSGSLLEVSICTFFLYVYGTFMTNKISKLVSDGLILSSIPQVWNGRSEHLGNDFLRLLDCFTTDFHSRSFTSQEESVSHRGTLVSVFSHLPPPYSLDSRSFTRFSFIYVSGQ
ncbi:hypothetical protein HanPI659440_Chr10g0379881 [Helianthus annuus]|nr:hypothetical protein HanPI659440_Chr10g0379881 [Helianthus annuus]